MLDFSWQVTGGDLLQATVLITGVVVFAMRMNTRIRILEVQYNSLEKRLERNEVEVGKTLTNIEAKLDDVILKLGNKADR